MSWYDQYKKETILVNTTEEHNKFWASEIDKSHTATIRWGRLGTKGQQQIKHFSTEWDAANFVAGKQREKERKGYKRIEKTKFDKMCVEAAVVGTQNKCGGLQWVEITDEGSMEFKPASEERLMSPDCNPALRVDLETKKKYGGRDFFRLLLTFNQAFDLGVGHAVGQFGLSGRTLITKTHPLYELTEKVEEAIGRTLSS
jgi:predicted DNA-binding WGR domain protein